MTRARGPTVIRGFSFAAGMLYLWEIATAVLGDARAQLHATEIPGWMPLPDGISLTYDISATTCSAPDASRF